MEREPRLKVTVAQHADDATVKAALN